MSHYDHSDMGNTKKLLAPPITNNLISIGGGFSIYSHRSSDLFSIDIKGEQNGLNRLHLSPKSCKMRLFIVGGATRVLIFQSLNCCTGSVDHLI